MDLSGPVPSPRTFGRMRGLMLLGREIQADHSSDQPNNYEREQGQIFVHFLRTSTTMPKASNPSMRNTYIEILPKASQKVND